MAQPQLDIIPCNHDIKVKAKGVGWLFLALGYMSNHRTIVEVKSEAQAVSLGPSPIATIITTHGTCREGQCIVVRPWPHELYVTRSRRDDGHMVSGSWP